MAERLSAIGRAAPREEEQEDDEDPADRDLVALECASPAPSPRAGNRALPRGAPVYRRPLGVSGERAFYLMKKVLRSALALAGWKM